MKIRRSKKTQKGDVLDGIGGDGNSWSSFLDASDIRQGNTSELLYFLYLEFLCSVDHIT